jgi:hypothetical protein
MVKYRIALVLLFIAGCGAIEENVSRGRGLDNSFGEG